MKIFKFSLTLLVFVMAVTVIISGCATQSEAVVEETETAPEETAQEEAAEKEEAVEEIIEEAVEEEEPDIQIVDKIEEVKKTKTLSYIVEFEVDSARIRGSYNKNIQEAVECQAGS